MRKLLSLGLMLGGIACLLYGGMQIMSQHIKKNEALKQAHQIVNGDTNRSSEVSLPRELQKGDVLGILQFPRLGEELPIVHGTDEDDLERGVGHYATTALPGENDQILFSGHRDTVFRRMGELEIGDEIIVEMSYGTFTYKITDTDIVDADDTSVIRSTAPDEVLTLSTCYPFTYVGSAPDRYIIYAEPLQ